MSRGWSLSLGALASALCTGMLILMGASPARSQALAPYLDPAHAANLEEILLAPSGGDGFYVETVELPETRIYERINEGAASTGEKATVKGLWKSRMAAGTLPALKALGTIAILAGGAEVGWKIGREIDDRWLNLFGPGVGTFDGASPTITGISWHWHDTLTLGEEYGEGWYLHISSNCVDWGDNRHVFWDGLGTTPAVGCMATVAQAAFAYISAPVTEPSHLPEGAEFVSTGSCTGSGGLGGSWGGRNCGLIRMTESEMVTGLEVRDFRDWETGVDTPTHTTLMDDPTESVELAPGQAVLDTEGDTQDWVNIILDPSWEGGRTLPAPFAHETYADYVSRLQAAGWVGTFTRTDLIYPETYDPARGPDEAVYTAPQAGLTYPTDTAVEVYTNPNTVPDGSGTIGDCSCPPVDFSPLTDAGYGEDFPFGIFVWMEDTISSFDVAAVTPHIELDLGAWDVPGSSALDGLSFDVTLDFLDEYMGWIRTMITFVLWGGAIWYVGAKMLGIKYAGDPTDAIDEAYNL